MLALCVVLYEESATPFEDVYAYGYALEYGKESYAEKVEEFRRIYEKSAWLWLDMHAPAPTYYFPDSENLSQLLRSRYRQTGFSGWLSFPVASSYLEEDDKGYYPEYLADGNLSTCWCEGAEGPGIGQWIMIPVPNVVIGEEKIFQVGIGFVNGCGSASEFKVCNRIRRLLVEYYRGEHVIGGDPCDSPCREYVPAGENEEFCRFSLVLKDTIDWQYFSFEEMASKYLAYVQNYIRKSRKRFNKTGYGIAWDYWVIKLVVEDVYEGSVFKDRTCLSEIRLVYKDFENDHYIIYDHHGSKVDIPRERIVRVLPQE